jgi:hypothetical protein
MYWTEVFFFCTVAMVAALCIHVAGNMIHNIYQSEKEDK